MTNPEILAHSPVVESKPFGGLAHGLIYRSNRGACVEDVFLKRYSKEVTENARFRFISFLRILRNYLYVCLARHRYKGVCNLEEFTNKQAPENQKFSRLLELHEI